MLLRMQVSAGLIRHRSKCYAFDFVWIVLVAIVFVRRPGSC
jgi:hypothetical protein